METLSFRKTAIKIIAETEFAKSLPNPHGKVYKISANQICV